MTTCDVRGHTWTCDYGNRSGHCCRGRAPPGRPPGHSAVSPPPRRSTSPLLNDLPKRRLNPLQPEEADMAVPHLLEARAAYLAQMHRRAERDRERVWASGP